MLVSRIRFRRFGLASRLVLLALMLGIITACGNGEEEDPFLKITPSDTTYALEDFQAVGFKKSKQYDVTGLPGGVDAYMGFFGPSPSKRAQFEIRFYASHADAIDRGTPLAEEVTGDAAGDFRLNPTWEDGKRDRWIAGAASSGGQMPSAPRPYYGDFAIIGNVLMLCESGAVSEPLELCENLVNALVGTDGG